VSRRASSRRFDEWVTLAFLTERAIEPRVAPRFFGGDADARVFVMEDLGPGHTLEDLLRDGDAAAAAEALVALARLIGSLQASLMDVTVDFDRRAAALTPDR